MSARDRWVGGRYRIEAELGAGGSATVHLVHDRVLDRPAALKLLSGGERDGSEHAERLRAEARALAALDHPHVVAFYELGSHEGHEFIAMEYFERGSLADRLAVEGPLPAPEAVRAVLQVLSALGAAHAVGIVHRDVKPGNVLVRADGTVALGDFGIARLDESTETRAGIALGSIPFMSPEQRIDSRRAGPQADLYGAACCLYNLLTADTPVDLYLAADSSPRWEAIPAPLRPILRRATRSEPSQRFHDAAEMTAALEAVAPALDTLAPVRARLTPLPPPGYAPTRAVDEPSAAAERRERMVDVEAWRMASRRALPVGRTAIWLGVTVLLFATTTFVALGPLADGPPPPVAAPPPAPPAPPSTVAGAWHGTLGGNPMHLELRGGSSVEGDVVVELASHELLSRVAGTFDGQELVLVEAKAERPQTFRAQIRHGGLILEGTVARDGAESLPFALVRVR